MQFPFSFWKKKSGPVWPTGVRGNLTQTGGNLELFQGVTYDFNNVTLNGVSIFLDIPGGGPGDGNPTIIGVLGNLSMINCQIFGNNNGDLFYDGAGGRSTNNYSYTDPAGKALSYTVTSSQGGDGDSDSDGFYSGGAPAFGNGGGGASGAGVGNDGLSNQSGSGAPDGNGDGAGQSALIYGGNGGDGTDNGDSFGPGGGGGSVGLSGQNLMFNIFGNVTAFSGNIIDLNGSPGGDGGAGVSANDSGGGGGGGAGGFGGCATFWVHGTGSGLITALQFLLDGGTSGGHGIDDHGNGSDGQDGQTGLLVKHTY